MYALQFVAIGAGTKGSLITGVTGGVGTVMGKIADSLLQVIGVLRVAVTLYSYTPGKLIPGWYNLGSLMLKDSGPFGPDTKSH